MAVQIALRSRIARRYGMRARPVQPRPRELEPPPPWVEAAHAPTSRLSLPRRHGDRHAYRAELRRGAARLADADLLGLRALDREHRVDKLAGRLLRGPRVERGLRVVLDAELDRLGDLRPREPVGQRQGHVDPG